MYKILLVTFSLLLSTFLVKSQVVINEYSCSNQTTIADAYGEYEDWIELYNAGSSPIDLTGYFLSNKSTNLQKWQIPSGSISANGYKMVFCSKRNTVTGAQYHPNFGLKQTEGDWIILTSPAGTVADSFKIVHMTKSGHSVGRSANGATDWKLFTTPTPNASNTGGVSFYTPTPTLSLGPGFYVGSQTVTISCSDVTASIYYTLDGSTPTSSSTAYAGPITISTTSIVRAVAYSTSLPSFVESNTYFIDVTHSIPVVSIAGQGVYNLIADGNISTPNGFFELFEQNGQFVDEGQGEFNKHGNDSWLYDQRGFDFVMKDQLGYAADVEHQIFPEKTRDNFQRLIFKAGASDNYPFEPGGAHIRDAFVHTLSIRAGMKLDERTWRPCVVYLNGQYWGVYEMREKVDDHDYTDYYYDQDKFHLYYLKTWGNTWEEYGTPNALTEWNTLKAYVQNNNMGVATNFTYVDSLLNWESLVDYFVFNSYVVNQDWLNWNTSWWRGTDPLGDKKKWRYALWDMDATFGHYINYTGIPDNTVNASPCENAEQLPNPGGQGHTEILQKLIAENPTVKQYYITRYQDLVNTYFKCSYMTQLLDSMVGVIQPEMSGQIQKWGGSLTEWQTNVTDLRNFINQRCSTIEAGMIGCYNLDGPYPVVFDVSPPNTGTIKVNSDWAPSYPWSAEYYGGINTNVIAKAAPGYMFDHWEFVTGPMNLAITQDTNSVDVSAADSIIAVFVVENPDIDGDGILNDDETSIGTDPLNPDTDGDGQHDNIEIGADITNPTDTDGDGIIDALESSIVDTDGDGVMDETDIDNTNPCIPSVDAGPCDQDNDGLTNAEEIAEGTNKTNPDTDGDGVNDGDEVNQGSNPLDKCSPDIMFPGCQEDTDNDGLYDIIEDSLGTDPEVQDTDIDGVNDGDEVANGTNPLDPCDPYPVGERCIDGIYIPTAFSPNNVGNPKDQIFSIIVGKNIKTFHFALYDRWGNTIIDTEDTEVKWDGTFNGIPCNSGVYAYILDALFLDNSELHKAGNITLIR